MKQNRVSDGLMFKMENDPRVIGSEKDQAKESETLSAKPRWMNSRSSSMC